MKFLCRDFWQKFFGKDIDFLHVEKKKKDCYYLTEEVF
jgi:hypothetical protein